MIGDQLIYGTLLLLTTLAFHVVALVGLAKLLQTVGSRSSIFLFGMTIFFILAIHTIEAWSWAAMYYFLDEFNEIEEALYFSVVTITTLGYGDITLSEQWRLLGTFEAMGGLILFGVSVAFMMEVVRRLFFKKTD